MQPGFEIYSADPAVRQRMSLRYSWFDITGPLVGVLRDHFFAWLLSLKRHAVKVSVRFSVNPRLVNIAYFFNFYLRVRTVPA